MNGSASDPWVSARHSHAISNNVMIGTGERNARFRPGKPTLRDMRLKPWCPHADNRDRCDDPKEAPASVASRPILQTALRLQDKPAGAQKPISEQQADPGKDREDRKAIERTTTENSSRRLETLNEGSQHDALGKYRNTGPITKGVVPECPMLGKLVTELEGDAAKCQRQQHHQDGEVECRYDDGEGQGKCRHEPDAAKHEPSFVAVPDRCDRVHHELRERRSGAKP